MNKANNTLHVTANQRDQAVKGYEDVKCYPNPQICDLDSYV